MLLWWIHEVEKGSWSKPDLVALLLNIYIFKKATIHYWQKLRPMRFKRDPFSTSATS